MNVTNIILMDNIRGCENNPYILQTVEGEPTKFRQEEKSSILKKIVDDISQEEVSIEILTGHIDDIKKYYIVKSYLRDECKSEYNNITEVAIYIVESILIALDESKKKLIADLRDYVINLSRKEENMKTITPRRLDSLLAVIDELKDLITYRFSNHCEMAVLYEFIQDNYSHESKDHDTENCSAIDKVKEFISKVRKIVYSRIYESNDGMESLEQENSEGTDTLRTNNKHKVKNIKNYDDLLGKAGSIYNDLMNEYDRIGLIDSINRFSHEVIYEIASQILLRTNYYFCQGLTSEQFSHDITNSIINYIHNNTEYKDIDKYSNEQKLRELIGKLVIRYLDGRKIKHYYYYLRMCSNIMMYVMPCYEKSEATESESSPGHNNSDLPDNIEERKKLIASIIAEKTEAFNFSFLQNIQDNDMCSHILATYESRL